MFAISDYLSFSAISLGYIVVFLSPIIYAAILANFPSKLPKRAQFSLVCGALSYGSIILGEVALLPIHLAAIFLAPSWHASGYLEIAKYSIIASEYSFFSDRTCGYCYCVLGTVVST